MVEKPGLAVGVTPHLDVVDRVAQDAGSAGGWSTDPGHKQ